MTNNYSFRYPAETIFETLTDPDFLVQRSLALGEKHIECEMESEGRTTTVVLTRTIKRELPAFLAKLFGDENRMTMTEKWERVGDYWMGSYQVEVHGQPVVLTAKFSLKPGDGGSNYAIQYKCKASIPVVGGKVEKFILGQTEDGMIREMDFLQKYLDDR